MFLPLRVVKSCLNTAVKCFTPDSNWRIYHSNWTSWIVFHLFTFSPVTAVTCPQQCSNFLVQFLFLSDSVLKYLLTFWKTCLFSLLQRVQLSMKLEPIATVVMGYVSDYFLSRYILPVVLLLLWSCQATRRDSRKPLSPDITPINTSSCQLLYGLNKWDTTS